MAESDVERLAARRELAEKQYARVGGLVAERAADQPARRRAEERPRRRPWLPNGPARIAVLTARAKLLAAEAEIDKAKADAVEARASLGVAEARPDRLKVNLDYARIVAPFDGVVTHRTFHPGALIRSAIEGGQQCRS